VTHLCRIMLSRVQSLWRRLTVERKTPLESSVLKAQDTRIHECDAGERKSLVFRSEWKGPLVCRSRQARIPPAFLWRANLSFYTGP
jgi:hypothetical protein